MQAPETTERMETLLSPNHTTTRGTVTGCVESAGLFQDQLLEEPTTVGSSAETRRRSAGLEQQAGTLCRACPLIEPCLYRAVVEHDVTGYVAGTSARQRTEIRRRLRVVVPPEDFDTLAGVVGAHRQVDHTEVLRLRAAHADESLEVLAGRLGCSLSTVKRHLRRERTAPSTAKATAPAPRELSGRDIPRGTAAAAGQLRP
jgi:hypothetical protein